MKSKIDLTILIVNRKKRWRPHKAWLLANGEEENDKRKIVSRITGFYITSWLS